MFGDIIFSLSHPCISSLRRRNKFSIHGGTSSIPVSLNTNSTILSGTFGKSLMILHPVISNTSRLVLIDDGNSSIALYLRCSSSAAALPIELVSSNKLLQSLRSNFSRLVAFERSGIFLRRHEELKSISMRQWRGCTKKEQRKF
ncbi:hypothetical protein BRARA_B00765 [Brassica rapa]|uniref:Uncharacterized protein n=1 Tax=Brassica campestris TaxID=3711 RepID=A0A398A761_BRACM|nr:hypothetical protein BRARA_B00765 [Brassica rapa]